MKELVTIVLACFFSGALLAQSLSTSESKITDLMENPEARAILEKYLPEVISNDQFSMAGSFTLKFIQSFDQTGEITDENLEKIDRELAALGSDSK